MPEPVLTRGGWGFQAPICGGAGGQLPPPGPGAVGLRGSFGDPPRPLTFLAVPTLPRPPRCAASTRGTPAASGSPGIGNFTTFPGGPRGGRGRGLQGAIAQVRPRSPPHPAVLTWGRGYRGGGAPSGGSGLRPCPPRRPRRWVGASLRSPPPGMGAAAAVGSRAGFRARVGERGARAAAGGGRAGAASIPAGRRAPCGDLWPPSPSSHPRDKGRGAHPHA